MISSVKNPYFDEIVSGKKIIEARLNDNKWSNIEVGDVIIIFKKLDNGKIINNNVKVVVEYIRHYVDIENMLLTEGLQHVFPSVTTVAEGVEIYKNIYSKEKLDNIIAFGIKLIE